MEPKGSPLGVFPHKNKPSSIHISQQSQELTSGAVTTNLIAPLTPRIDISRASSSSYHEDSSPENVFDQVRRLLFYWDHVRAQLTRVFSCEDEKNSAHGETIIRSS